MAVNSPAAARVGAPPAGRSSPRRLVLLDDFFPNQLSTFRLVEFERYLEAFPNAVCHSTVAGFDLHHAAYAAARPELAERVHPFGGSLPAGAEVAFAVGLNTAFAFLETVEAAGVPFVFELYPGFGFHLDDPRTEVALRRLFTSPCFERAIVTQSVTQRYVLGRGLVDPRRIAYKYGFVTDVSFWSREARPRLERETIDLAFVANRYMPGGRDKGFDVFVTAAARLAERSARPVHCHVVGSWTAADVPPVTTVADVQMTFYGLRPREFFPGFYAGVDAIVSPNAPGILAPGAFDGFPTGAVVEAMLSGVPAFVTDPLRLNSWFRPEREIVLIERDPTTIAEALGGLLADPVRLRAIGERGRARATALFNLDAQMAPRFAALGLS